MILVGICDVFQKNLDMGWSPKYKLNKIILGSLILIVIQEYIKEMGTVHILRTVDRDFFSKEFIESLFHSIHVIQ